MPGERSARRRGVMLVLTATVLWSLAGLFARLLAHLDVWTVLGWRALLGSASISLVGLIEWRRGRLDNPFGFGPLSPLVALLAMIAISAYTASVMTTTIADVMVIYATLALRRGGDRLARQSRAASRRARSSPRRVALAGIAVIFANGLGSGRLAGEALSRPDDARLRRHGRAAAPAAEGVDDRRQCDRRARLGPLRPHQLAASAARPFDLAVLFVFGLTTIGLSFVLFMEGAKFIPSAEAGLISLLDVVLAPIWVFLAFGENPGAATLLGGAIVLGAALWRIAPDLRREADLSDGGT